MQNYPTLKTSIPFLQLQPLQRKHLPFMVELLSIPEIQRLLYRVPTKISLEKEEKAIQWMYESEKAKEITYILTIKKVFTEKYIGYVKIKIIDWSVKSCYISIAILPNSEYRGKGYAKATYDSFFEYLFSLGFMKIYGRTYEQNISTIKLNKATGFDFVGRQHDFVLYPDDTSLDALLFEKLNPLLAKKYQKPYITKMSSIARILEPIASARRLDNVTTELIAATLLQLEEHSFSSLPEPLQLYLKEITTSLRAENTSNTHSVSLFEHTPTKELFHRYRAENARSAGYNILESPITLEQCESEQKLIRDLRNFLTAENSTLEFDATNCFRYGGYTEHNWHYLEPLFLGKPLLNNSITIIKAMSGTTMKI